MMSAAILPWIYTGLAVGITAASHVTFKLHANRRSIKWLILTGCGFVAVPLFSYLALRDLSIGQVYLCTAIVPVLTTMGAGLFLGEKLSWHHLVGIGLITGGMVLYLGGVGK